MRADGSPPAAPRSRAGMARTGWAWAADCWCRTARVAARLRSTRSPSSTLSWWRANCVAEWDGSTWSALGSGLDWPVTALTVFQGDLIAGGQFSNAGGKPSAHWAQWRNIPAPEIGAQPASMSVQYGQDTHLTVS